MLVVPLSGSRGVMPSFEFSASPLVASVISPWGPAASVLVPYLVFENLISSFLIRVVLVVGSGTGAPRVVLVGASSGANLVIKAGRPAGPSSVGLVASASVAIASAATLSCFKIHIRAPSVSTALAFLSPAFGAAVVSSPKTSFVFAPLVVVSGPVSSAHLFVSCMASGTSVSTPVGSVLLVGLASGMGTSLEGVLAPVVLVA